MPDRITALARRCAALGLDLRAAQNLFDALYAADALIRTQNNRTAAAELAGVDRATILRLSRGSRPPVNRVQTSDSDAFGRSDACTGDTSHAVEFSRVLAPAVGIEPTTN